MKQSIETIRHSLSHVLAAAVMEMFPEAKLGIGPAIENGFYYDFDFETSADKRGNNTDQCRISEEDFPRIEEKMRKIINSDAKFERLEISSNEAIEQFNNAGQEYKVELIKDLESSGEKNISIYRTGQFLDLCKGPHVEKTADLKNIGWKLDKIAGAYWKGSEKNKMLQRIYALAFGSEKELDEFLKNRQEVEKRDHRKIGADLDLFSFHPEGPGFPFWHPKGVILWNILLDWWRAEHAAAGYQEIKTPIILTRELWEQSGHWDHYKNNMYFTKIDDRDFAIKPMNCPGSILYYKEKLHSYKEFPLRIAEVGLVHRHELAGVLHGLMRVRAFHQDDAHIFCTEEQIESEVNDIIDLTDKMYRRLGLKYHIELSTRPESDSIGTDAMWQKAEKSLKNVLKGRKNDYKLNPGDGAFYGPKIDFHIEDAIGRTWQLGTIQLDFAMPERFDLKYIDNNSKEKQLVMIHRVIFGAIERFIGILIEHFAGAFPIWLAPVQAVVLPISEKHSAYADKIIKELKKQEIRAEIDDRNESIGRKIRDAELAKIPYMLIVGDKEIASKKVAVRKYGEGDLGQKNVSEIIKQIQGEK